MARFREHRAIGAGRSLRASFAILAVVLLASACAVGGGGGAGAPKTPEEELARRAQDMQRSVQEAALAGFLSSGGVYVLGGPRGPGAGLAVIGVIPVGVAVGSYVGYLNQQYPNDEARRARLVQDINRTRAEGAAAIENIRTVVARHDARAAEARAAGSPEVREEVDKALAQNIDSMISILRGLRMRQVEFEPALVKFSPPGTDPAVDSGAQAVTAQAETVEQLIVYSRGAPVRPPPATRSDPE